jgi:hypothetical protein
MLARRGADGSDVGTLETLQKLNRAGLRAWGRARFPRLRLKVRRKRGWFWW